MPQLHFYVPDETAKRLKSKAAAAGVSVSKYIADVVAKEADDKGWPPGYFEYFRNNPIPDDFELPEDPPIDPNDYPRFD